MLGDLKTAQHCCTTRDACTQSPEVTGIDTNRYTTTEVVAVLSKCPP